MVPASKLQNLCGCFTFFLEFLNSLQPGRGHDLAEKFLFRATCPPMSLLAPLPYNGTTFRLQDEVHANGLLFLTHS